MSFNPGQVAVSQYGPAFGSTDPEILADAFEDWWSQLAPEERSYIQAHLQFLNVIALSQLQAELGHIVEGFEELGDIVRAELDVSEPEGDDELDGPSSELQDTPDPGPAPEVEAVPAEGEPDNAGQVIIDVTPTPVEED